jgi:hypothetical protein
MRWEAHLAVKAGMSGQKINDCDADSEENKKGTRRFEKNERARREKQSTRRTKKGGEH